MAVREPGRRLRILVSMQNFWFVKQFESVLHELAARGHAVHILAHAGERNEAAQDWNRAAAALAAVHPNTTFSWAPRDVEDLWVDLRLIVRCGFDYLRFRSPAYAAAPILEARAVARTPVGIVRLVNSRFGRTRAGLWLIAGLLRAVERLLPIDPELSACIREQRADVMLITPLVTLGSEQQDVLRVARRLGLPSALCVGSWDHLSSKALIRTQPDRVFVWNDTQRHEATALHGVPADRVVITGAQCFDEWFERRPAQARDEFCRRLGLDASRPYVLYVCSALFEGSPSEAAFVARWIAAVRASARPELREAGILVRPHPKRGFEWDAVDLSGLEHVALWPPRGAAPFDVDTKNDYFDALYHSAAVVGLNTSALIEAGIVGRPVHTILLPEFRDNQEGTLHFHYLLAGGLLRTTRDLDTHVEQVADALAAPAGDNPNRGFLEGFVRPRGLSVPATPVFVEAVEQLAGAAIAPEREPIWAPMALAIMAPLARRWQGTFAVQVARRRRELEKERLEQQKARDKQEGKRLRVIARAAEREQQRQQAVADREARRESERRERAARIMAKERQHEQKERDKETRQARRQRHQRRAAFNARVVGWCRRVAGMGGGR